MSSGGVDGCSGFVGVLDAGGFPPAGSCDGDGDVAGGAGAAPPAGAPPTCCGGEPYALVTGFCEPPSARSEPVRPGGGSGGTPWLDVDAGCVCPLPAVGVSEAALPPLAAGQDTSSPMTAAADAATPATAPRPLEAKREAPRLRWSARAGPITTSGLGEMTLGSGRAASSSQAARTWSRSQPGACAGARRASSRGSRPFSNAEMRSSRASVAPRIRMSRTARSSRVRAALSSCMTVSGARPRTRAMSCGSSHSPADSSSTSRWSERRPPAARSSGSGSANSGPRAPAPMPGPSVNAPRSAQAVRESE